MASGTTDTLKSFSADRDENGQTLSDAPTDRASPAHLQRRLASDPGGEAETARLASGRPNDDATAATEAEMPEGALAKLRGEGPAGAAKEAIDRATAPLGKD